MIDLKEWFEPEYQYRLENVSFFSFEEEAGKEFVSRFFDTIDYEMDNQTLKARYTRRIQFEPKGILDIKVSFVITMRFKDELPGEISDLTKELDDALQDTKCPYVAAVAAKASILISQLTIASGQNPIVTQPTFLKAE